MKTRSNVEHTGPGSPGDYGKNQIKKSLALLKEYGTADPKQIELIKKNREEANEHGENERSTREADKTGDKP